VAARHAWLTLNCCEICPRLSRHGRCYPIACYDDTVINYIMKNYTGTRLTPYDEQFVYCSRHMADSSTMCWTRKILRNMNRSRFRFPERLTSSNMTSPIATSSSRYIMCKCWCLALQCPQSLEIFSWATLLTLTKPLCIINITIPTQTRACRCTLVLQAYRETCV